MRRLRASGLCTLARAAFSQYLEGVISVPRILRDHRLWPLGVLVLVSLLLLPGLGSYGFWEPQEMEVAARALPPTPEEIEILAVVARYHRKADPSPKHEEFAALIGRIRDQGTPNLTFVIGGADGLDEITTTGPTYVAELKDGKVRSFEIAPQDAGMRLSDAQSLRGGDAGVHVDLAE